MPRNTHYIGKAGEHMVAGHLLLREIPVSFPEVDTGVDIIAGNGIRVQVKSSHSRVERTNGYMFTMSARTPKNGHKQYRLKHREYHSFVDFMILWGIEDNRFWVIPAHALVPYRTTQTLVLGSTGYHRFIDYDRVNDLLCSGLTQAQVARDMNVSQMAISQIVRGKTTDRHKCAGLILDKYEGAWHEIEAAVRLAEEIDSIESMLSPNEIEAAKFVTQEK